MADRDQEPGMPLKDHGSFAYHHPSENDEIEGHHSDRWQQHAMYVGLHMPKRGNKRHHRKRHHRRPGDQTSPPEEKTLHGESDAKRGNATPPSQRVQFILGMNEEEDQGHQPHELFCEMGELRQLGDEGDMEWRETARWIKFEENVEEGGERWSKPHVATLALHSLFELRKGIMAGCIMLDIDATTLLDITNLVLDNMVANKMLDHDKRERVQEVLLTRHRHQHQKKTHTDHKGSSIPLIRSFADIGRKSSSKNIEARRNHFSYSPPTRQSASPPSFWTNMERVYPHLHEIIPEEGASTSGPTEKDGEASGMKTSASASHLKPNMSAGKKYSTNDLGKPDSSYELGETASTHKFNEHFFKKIPPGAEASNILVGEVDFLTNPIIGFVRLTTGVMLGDLTEVPVPTRFIFMLLGPSGNMQRYHEIGRSIATLMSDEVFHEVAYKARNRGDLLAGIDEFLDQVIVLPPGEWDPTIRIEPPKSVPSQEARRAPGAGQSGLPNGMAQAEAPAEEHDDTGLVRTGRLFGGLIQDIKRKWKWYASDYKDCLHIQCVASFFFMYFACLTPIITFGGLLGAATNNNIAAMESLVSGAICGISYHLFSGQPLTVIGSTGPVLVFETILYNFCNDYGLNYLGFRFWIGMWMGLALLLMVMFDLSALVRYITRFTEESFAMLIALIFIYEAFKKLFHILDHYPIQLDWTNEPNYDCWCVPKNETMTNTTMAPGMTTDMPMTTMTMVNTTPYDWNNSEYRGSHFKEKCEEAHRMAIGPGCNTPDYRPDVFFLCCLLFLGTFILSMGLKNFRNKRFFPNKVRVLISDFAVFTAIVAMVVTDLLVGLDTPKLETPDEFRPTRDDRNWIVNPFANKWWWIPAGIPPSLLATILIFMDQQITAVIVNRKENKLRKGGGYHLDLFIIAIQIMICSLVGTPWFVAATVLSINHVRSLTRESETSAPGERPKFLGIREQRVTGAVVFTMVGLSALMSSVLKLIPMAVLYGVFLFMGISSIKGIQFVQRVAIMFMPGKYQPDYLFLRHVPVRRAHLFTAIQMLCLAILWIIKQTKEISISFPLMVLAMCFVRKGLDWVFTRHELKWLDDIMPESHKREKEEKKKMLEQDEVGEDGKTPIGQVLEMQGGAINIPLKDGKSLKIPVENLTFDPKSNQLNISEEMSKTAIWKQLVHNESTGDFQKKEFQPRRRSNANGRKSDIKEEEEEKAPVKFTIADETEETDNLIAPEILIDPPSRGGSMSSESKM